MNMKKILKNNKGISLTDVIIAVIVIVVFAGVTASYMYSNYRIALQVQATSNANAYATLIMEKVDEKSFEEVDGSFLDKITSEISMDSRYTASFTCEDIDDTFKKCSVTITYGINEFGSNKQITLKKVKVKEIGNM